MSRAARKRERSDISHPQFNTANAQSEMCDLQSVDLGFRRFRPPLRAMVEAGRGYPTEINAWGKDRSVYGKVVGLAGPWRASGEWWRPDLWARDEWDVAVEVRGQRSEVRGQRSEIRGQRGRALADF